MQPKFVLQHQHNQWQLVDTHRDVVCVAAGSKQHIMKQLAIMMCVVCDHDQSSTTVTASDIDDGLQLLMGGHEDV